MYFLYLYWDERASSASSEISDMIARGYRLSFMIQRKQNRCRTCFLSLIPTAAVADAATALTMHIFPNYIYYSVTKFVEEKTYVWWMCVCEQSKSIYNKWTYTCRRFDLLILIATCNVVYKCSREIHTAHTLHGDMTEWVRFTSDVRLMISLRTLYRHSTHQQLIIAFRYRLISNWKQNHWWNSSRVPRISRLESLESLRLDNAMHCNRIENAHPHSRWESACLENGLHRPFPFHSMCLPHRI